MELEEIEEEGKIYCGHRYGYVIVRILALILPLLASNHP